VSTRTEAPQADERAWLLRALLVLQSPRPVFAALRDGSEQAAQARQEPITAIVVLAGIASVLWTPVAGSLLDNRDVDGLVVAVWAFIGGAFYGILGYWLGGALLQLGLRAAGSLGDYRRARHLLAFAAAPIALSLVLWPVRLAVYGSDVFRSGGADGGAGDGVFVALALGFVAWALVLLLVGVRTVHGWGWRRTVEGVGVAVVTVAGLVVLLQLLSG
jgi:Yip1 domain